MSWWNRLWGTLRGWYGRIFGSAVARVRKIAMFDPKYPRDYKIVSIIPVCCEVADTAVEISVETYDLPSLIVETNTVRVEIGIAMTSGGRLDPYVWHRDNDPPEDDVDS